MHYYYQLLIIHYYYQFLIIHYAPSSGQSVALWDLSLGKQAWTYNGHGDQVNMISFYVWFVWYDLLSRFNVSISIVHGWIAAEYFKGIFRNRCKRWPGSGKEVWLRHRLVKVLRTFFLDWKLLKSYWWSFICRQRTELSESSTQGLMWPPVKRKVMMGSKIARWVKLVNSCLFRETKNKTVIFAMIVKVSHRGIVGWIAA